MEGTKSVQEILRGIGLEKFTDDFKQNDIDATTFLTLSKEDIEQVLPGMLVPQKKIVQEIQRLNDLRNKKSGHSSTSLQDSKLESQKLQPQSSASTAKNDPIQRRNAAEDKHRNIGLMEMKATKQDTQKPVTKTSGIVPQVAAIAGQTCTSLIQRSIISKITAPYVTKLLHGVNLSTVDAAATNQHETTNDARNFSSDPKNAEADKNLPSEATDAIGVQESSPNNKLGNDDFTQTHQTEDDWTFFGDETLECQSVDCFGLILDEEPGGDLSFQADETSESPSVECAELTFPEETENIFTTIVNAVFGILDS